MKIKIRGEQNQQYGLPLKWLSDDLSDFVCICNRTCSSDGADPVNKKSS